MVDPGFVAGNVHSVDVKEALVFLKWFLSKEALNESFNIRGVFAELAGGISIA
jgi:hypothetical protein